MLPSFMVTFFIMSWRVKYAGTVNANTPGSPNGAK